jgi:hypothetical protein
MALGDDEFFAFVEEAARAIGSREFRRDLYERALAYPWERPSRSFVFRDGEVKLVDDLDSESRAATIASFTRDRYPIVSFGGNAAPSSLAVKVGHFPERVDREALVLAGDLHGVDVGAIGAPGMMGFIPAALFASPGTAVRAAVTWVTPAQATQLTWSEITYRLGRLEDVRFEADDAAVQIEDVFAYVSRFGAFCIDGEPVALAAVSAKGRRATAFTQEELLDVVAGMLLGGESRAEDLVRAVFDDLAEIYRLGVARMRPLARKLEMAWTPFPASGA